MEVFLPKKMVARTIYVKSEQVEALKKLSEKTKVPQSVYVREALDMLLEKYSDQLKFEFKKYGSDWLRTTDLNQRAR